MVRSVWLPRLCHLYLCAPSHAWFPRGPLEQQVLLPCLMYLVRRHARSEFLSFSATKPGPLCSITKENVFPENPFVLNQWSMKSRNTWVNSKDCRLFRKFLRQSGPFGAPLLCYSWVPDSCRPLFFFLSSLWAVTSALKLCSWLHPKEWWERERKNIALHPFLDSPSFYNLKKKISKLNVLPLLPTF